MAVAFKPELSTKFDAYDLFKLKTPTLSFEPRFHMFIINGYDRKSQRKEVSGLLVSNFLSHYSFSYYDGINALTLILNY